MVRVLVACIRSSSCCSSSSSSSSSNVSGSSSSSSSGRSNFLKVASTCTPACGCCHRSCRLQAPLQELDVLEGGLPTGRLQNAICKGRKMVAAAALLSQITLNVALNTDRKLNT